MCCSDGMNVTGQMQIEIFHRDDLGITAPRCTTFDTKGRTLGWLADHSNDSLAKMCAERLTQSHGRRSLAFTKWRRGDGSHINIFAIWTFGKAIKNFKF